MKVEAVKALKMKSTEHEIILFQHVVERTGVFRGYKRVWGGGGDEEGGMGGHLQCSKPNNLSLSLWLAQHLIKHIWLLVKWQSSGTMFDICIKN